MRSALAPVTAFIVIVVSAAAAFAETRPIRGETIKFLISGGTVELDTPIGAKLPLKFDPDGTVTGTSIVLAFYLGSTTDRGRWWISGNKLCTKFSRWFDHKSSCLVIRPDGFRFAWTKDDGDTGTASIISKTKRLYGSASALTGGVSAATMVRNADERAAAAVKAKAVQVAALSAPPKPKPLAPVHAPAAYQPQPEATPRLALAVMEQTREDDPSAWLPMSAVREAINPTPVTVAAEFLPWQEAASPPTYRVAGVTSSDALNVRRGPQPDADVVGSIPAKAHGVVVSGSCQDTWCPVTYQQQSGWVSHQFLEAE